jgi:aminomethyltransferase
VSLRQSPLRAAHEKLGARLVEFGGWEMPLSYPSGTLAEHLACRADAVVFDVSHLGTVRVEGQHAFAALQSTLTNDLTRIAPGGAQYTHLLADDASVMDDIIVWWVGPARFDVMPNASNTARVRAAIGGLDVTAERAVMAVQGPRARALLAAVSPEAAEVSHFRAVPFTFDGAPCVAAGTGYTGEDGVECAVPSEVAEHFWDALVAAGIAPAGLGARDTLRLEAGFPLHGHELGPGITPLQAGLSWVVGWDKPEFLGREALLAERASGPRRRLRGLVGESRRPLHAGDSCLVEGTAVGEVTSGNFSPVLERGIALAFLPPDVAEGGAVGVQVRGSVLPTTVRRPPFHKLEKR